MRIAICDDEPIFVDVLKDKATAEFEKYYDVIDHFHIDTFTDGRELLEENKANPYNIVFLDVDMPKTDGFSAADELAHFYQDTYLVFVSAYPTYAVDAYVYDAYRFIPKHDLDQRLHEAIGSIMREYKENQLIYEFSYNWESFKFHVGKIIYFEYVKNGVDIITTEGRFRQIENMKSLEAKMNSMLFIRPHSGYLVNPKFISKIDGKLIYLKDGTTIPISRLRLSDVKIRYHEYCARLI